MKPSAQHRTRRSSTRSAGWQRARAAGFTLIELLVVIAVIGTLIGLLLPAVQAARGAARRTQCASNLRQLAIAAQTYHASREHFPAGLHQFEVSSPPRFRGTSLFTYLLPYLEQGNLLSDWDYEAPLRNTVGGPASRSAQVIDILLCPADVMLQNPIPVGDACFGMTSYGGNGGTRSYYPDLATADGLFHTTGPASQPKPNQVPVTLAMIRDGASNTILCGERRHDDANWETFAAMQWTESLTYLGRWAAIGGRKRIADVTMSGWAPINYQLPFDFAHRHQADPPLESSRAFQPYEDLRICSFGSAHAGGANFAFADGSLRFLADSLTPTLLQSLCTRAGGEQP
jgi:prepilin-type N-terminal cleavage/methylation domain-containing protein/prepilin-type processing-associated H-X9-DG protein